MTPVEFPRAQKDKKLINLLRGWPSTHVLPAELLKTAANKVLSDPALAVPSLQYGPDAGYQPLREELSHFLAEYYATAPDAERLCITGGASQSLACLLQSFTEPVYTQAVWAVAPCYYLACPIFEDAGFAGRLRAVPEDAEGIDLAYLARGLRACEEGRGPGDEAPVYKHPNLRKVYRHVVYVVPSAANPSGKTMSLRRREALVQLAREYDCLVICDDVYDFLQWQVDTTTTPSTSSLSSSGLLPRIKPLPRLSDIDFALGPSKHDLAQSGKNDDDNKWFGHAVSNGSFSKIVGPGVRTGWVEGTRDFALGLAQTGSSKSGGAPSQLAAAVVCEAMRAGALARHIDGRCRPSLRRRHALLLAAVRRELGRFGAEARGGNELAGRPGLYYGGYFVWVTFPSQGAGGRRLTGAAIAQRALAQENLVVPPGDMFQVKGDEAAARFPHSVRLCFSWEDEADLVEGVARLGRAVESLLLEDSGAAAGAAVRGGAGEEGGGGGAEKPLDAFF